MSKVDVHIDGGHGGSDPGASGNGLVEKALTLEASLFIEKRLKELGFTTSMTRKDDTTVDPNTRGRVVRNSDAEVCLSNHYNAGGGEGVETIHSIHSKNDLAGLIAKEIAKVGQPLRRVFTRKSGNGDYYYMHRTTGSVQTVIIEYAFLDNNKDANRIKDKGYREKMYEAVVKALCTYFKKKYTNVSPPKSKPASNTPKASSVRALRMGDKSKAVIAMQKDLTKVGYPLVADGMFGKLSFVQVSKFQKDHGLAVDGYYGPLSMSKMKEALNVKTHTVRAGDTLWALSRKHGITVEELTKWNGIKDASILSVGQKLQVSNPKG